MIKNILALFAIVLVVSFETGAQAHYGRHPYPPRPYPTRPYPPRPYPYPNPQPYQVTCYTQGLANGAVFYGVGPDVYTANNWAFSVCQSTGQYCQSLGCQY
jgi:hypothetical protein